MLAVDEDRVESELVDKSIEGRTGNRQDVAVHRILMDPFLDVHHERISKTIDCRT